MRGTEKLTSLTYPVDGIKMQMLLCPSEFQCASSLMCFLCNSDLGFLIFPTTFIASGCSSLCFI